MTQLSTGIFLVWMVVASLVGASQEHSSFNSETRSLQVQERAGISLESAKAFIRNEKLQGGVPAFAGSLGGGIGQFATIDYQRPTNEVVKQIGDAIVPLLATGLALVPGGAVIGGVVAGVWGLLGPLFGGKSKMEKMIDDIKKDIDEIKERLKKLPDEIRLEREAKFRSVLGRAIQGQLVRNEYICSKYAIVSRNFSEYAENKSIPLPESVRSDLISQIHNCDNFLKDTSEAFVYDEYADTLWILAVITTMLRVSFLTEAANYGLYLGIDQETLELFWSQIKGDLKRTFIFAGLGIAQRVKTMKDKTTFYTETEMEACKIQAQLLYLDRDIYPYGVPKQFNIDREPDISETALQIRDYNVTESDEPLYIQMFDDSGIDYDCVPVFNCIVGVRRIIYLPLRHQTFRVTYIPNKSYQVRVLYFTTDSDSLVTAKEENDNVLSIELKSGKPNPESLERFSIKTQIHIDFGIKCLDVEAYSKGGTHSGEYVIENVHIFNVNTVNVTDTDTDADTDTDTDTDTYTGIIRITTSSSSLVFGIDLIVGPLVK